MRIEKMREEEMRRRRGSTLRTLLMLVWLAACAGGAYYLVNWLFTAGHLSYQTFYGRLSVPTSIPEPAIFAALILLLVFVMQFFLTFGYVLSTPTGRRRSGLATTDSDNPDPLSNMYG